ncbi:tryptophan synthase subunit alpha [Pectinatus cerevisiiphilus]|uniref:Tryptophan synthase alpha chain n=1 Tax=Pectinatus cerevisiiphilus TaxID=86956 RepID=A0A4R3KBR0_9FIRM|nr:tryptophan synthase subunit alpha [Pectinatus cerevisiiphilus]TCS80071.1 tryptophan synthase alpha chain [Pectinatus cerevisiiphilus]
MTKIQDAFKNKKAFIAFITAGDPDLETTEKIIISMVQNGVDLIELGIPFSDPIAEGPVIEQASMRSLANGTTTDKIFDMVKRVREKVHIPMAFMTYANLLFVYGKEKFFAKCREVDINAIIIPDIPFEEKDELLAYANKENVDMVSLIAPTSMQRVGMIAKEAQGFIYLVSSLGVTGVRSEIKTDLDSIVKVIRQNSNIPIGIGFGIATPEQAQKAAETADAAIVGSAIVKLIAQYGKGAPGPVGEYVKKMKDAVMRAAK